MGGHRTRHLDHGLYIDLAGLNEHGRVVARQLYAARRANLQPPRAALVVEYKTAFEPAMYLLGVLDRRLCSGRNRTMQGWCLPRPDRLPGANVRHGIDAALAGRGMTLVNVDHSYRSRRGTGIRPRASLFSAST